MNLTRWPELPDMMSPSWISYSLVWQMARIAGVHYRQWQQKEERGYVCHVAKCMKILSVLRVSGCMLRNLKEVVWSGLIDSSESKRKASFLWRQEGSGAVKETRLSSYWLSYAERLFFRVNNFIRHF